MNKLHVLPCVALVALAFIALPACARDAAPEERAAPARDCTPAVEDGWLRLPPVQMPMLAGFGRIENPCVEAITVVGVTSPAFADVSLHETRIVDGISQMRALPELAIAPGESATLQPGGMHLMLMQPTRALQAGETVEIEFQLDGGGAVSGQFQVRKPGA